ncbi:hypothetical protein NDU88_008592 [Pleurodeles waltl]|uniref:Uncharacterized protein n=1 Tax=Pleurodeles waltl TaxID=8319 RepID=A0AAV7RW66_PLEWA|nr:hypothetical protein NDU88_008592 [Pleurodeles waltl]
MFRIITYTPPLPRRLRGAGFPATVSDGGDLGRASGAANCRATNAPASISPHNPAWTAAGEVATPREDAKPRAAGGDHGAAAQPHAVPSPPSSDTMWALPPRSLELPEGIVAQQHARSLRHPSLPRFGGENTRLGAPGDKDAAIPMLAKPARCPEKDHSLRRVRMQHGEQPAQGPERECQQGKNTRHEAQPR